MITLNPLRNRALGACVVPTPCLGAASVLAADPYSLNEVITGVTWDFGNLVPTAEGSDIWPVTWNANPDNVDGYGVYVGPNPGQATQQILDVPLSTPEFDSATPAIVFNAGVALGLDLDDRACFSLSAYNAVGESGHSNAVRVTLQ